MLALLVPFGWGQFGKCSSRRDPWLGQRAGLKPGHLKIVTVSTL